MSNPTFINFLGQGDRLPTVMNYFRKGSIYANEDPLYLTFFLDFNPSVGDPHPETIAFNSLLMDMEPTAAREVNLANSPTGFELSTLEYLQRAYNQTYVSAKDGPAGNLRKFQTILNNIRRLHGIFKACPVSQTFGKNQWKSEMSGRRLR